MRQVYGLAMTDMPEASVPEPIRGNKAVEAAAVLWIMELERQAGREPVDRRHERGFPADIESPPRIIEIKASSTSYRGWFLPLEPAQLEAAFSNDNFYIYVVESIGQGDPAKFQLRILHGDQLHRLAAKATTRTYHEVSWPVAEYDNTPGKEALG
jgi:hypothetical protein